jgi:hypothetical protein
MTTARDIDRLTFDIYVDTNLDAAATARNMGCTARTVRARVRRHSLSLSAAKTNTNRGDEMTRTTRLGKVVGSITTDPDGFTYGGYRRDGVDGFIIYAPSRARMEWFASEADAQEHVARKNAEWFAPVTFDDEEV